MTTNTAGEALDLNKSRAEFEAWAENAAPAHDLERSERGNYTNYATHCAWAGYRAALARAGIAAPAAPTDTAKLLRCAVKYNESIHPADVLELCSFVDRCANLAAPTAAEGPSLDADEMRRLRRLVHVLGMDGSARRSDGQVRGLLFTALGQAAGKIEAAQKEGTSAQDAKDAERYRFMVRYFGVTTLPCLLERHFQRGYVADGKESIDAAIDAAMSAAQAQPKDTTKEKA